MKSWNEIRKAANYIVGCATECAFVSTNSITQGEQVPVLWKEISASINFAYRTFKWHNEAKGRKPGFKLEVR